MTTASARNLPPEDRERRSPRGPVPAILGRPLSWIYGAVVAHRNRRFDRGIGVQRLDRPVISIGNLSVGGTGKSPVTRWVAQTLLDAGRKPVIALRGYKAKRGISDEAEEHRAMLPGVPVVVGADRYAMLTAFFATQEGRERDCVILDDGFQHRQLARDLDIVLVDHERAFKPDQHLLPWGWLREPVEATERADIMIFTRSKFEPPDGVPPAHSARSINGREQLLGATRHVWTGVDVISSQAVMHEQVGWLRGKRVVLACAIANPWPLLGMATEACGMPPVYAVVRADHDVFPEAAINEIASEAAARQADAILVTGKDWAKLQRVPSDRWPCPIAVVRVGIEFVGGEQSIRERIIAAASRA